MSVECPYKTCKHNEESICQKDHIALETIEVRDIDYPRETHETLDCSDYRAEEGAFDL